MTITQKKEEKGRLERLSELFSQLTTEQLRFVAAMQNCTTKKEAAEFIGLTPGYVYKWPKIVDEAIRLVALETERAARETLKHNLFKATMVKVAGLDSESERVRQASATEIIEWELGKATQRQEIKIDARITDAERANRILAFFDSARERRDRSTSSSED